MSRVFVLANVFNERDALERMWESVKANVPAESVLVVVDGKYPDYPGSQDVSTDGTRDWARHRGHLVTCIDYECEKRNAGLRYIDSEAEDGDWILYLDADETITSWFSWPQRVGYISFTRKTNIPVSYGRCRLYRWEPGLYFAHRHYDLYSASGELVASLEDAPDYQTVGTGDHYEKPRTPEKQAYFNLLREREGSPWEKVSA